MLRKSLLAALFALSLFAAIGTQATQPHRNAIHVLGSTNVSSQEKMTMLKKLYSPPS